MGKKKVKNIYSDKKFNKHEPVEPVQPVEKGRPVKGDPFLEEEMEEEIEDIEKIEQETDEKISDIKKLQEEVSCLKDELQKSQETLLRAHAEMENIRHRATQDVAKAHKYGTEQFVKELLPVIDSLEKALESADEKDAMIEGVELTLQMLLKALEKHGVKQVDPHGEPFNPEFHEAMSIQENDEVDANTVLQVLQKGYVLNGRLIRPAMVIVSK